MKRRNFIKTFGSGIAASTITNLHAASKKPNFVFFLVDDLGIVDISCYGSTFHETPNIDRLCKSGMKFTDAYAACPVCSPTRAAIMTGKHPVRVNITDWIPGTKGKSKKLITPEDQHQLDLKEETIAEALKKNGYTTFFAGKWHLGDEGYYPEDQGFDINKGGHHKGSPPGGYYSPYNNPRLESGPEGEYLTDRLANESIKFLEDHSKVPFLLYLAFYTIHTPIQGCKEFDEKYKMKAENFKFPDRPEEVKEHNGITKQIQDNYKMAAMVASLDKNVGRVLKKLDELKLTDNTVIIFTSDNGGLSTKKKSGPGSNYPYRAGKGWCYEGGIRVASIIRAPGVTKPGSECSEPVTSMDYYPTMLDLAGLPLNPKQHVDGKNLAPLLRGAKKIDRDAIHWHYPHYHGSTWTPGAAIRMRDWKLIEFYEENKIELYNLKDDLSERKDLANKMPEKAKELQNALHAWQKQSGAKMPRPNPEYDQKK